MYDVDSQAGKWCTWWLVADGFWCKRCDGTIQETDLAGGPSGGWRDMDV